MMDNVEQPGGMGMSRAGSRQLDLSVVAPCYNEEGNVDALVSRLLPVFARHRIAGEIVLVNDCSTDATGELIDSLAARHPEVVAVHHPRNRGLCAAWDTGLATASGTYVCFIDADLQNPPEEVWRLYREITQSHADMVQGVRSSIGRLKDGRYLVSRVLNVILNSAFGMSATDNKSGFVMALRETMADTMTRRLRYRYFHVFVTISAHAKGFRIREVETLFQSRNAGTSFIKQWPVRLIAEVGLDIVKAFVEFRLTLQRRDGFEQFVRNAQPSRRIGPAKGWSRAVLALYCARLRLRNRLITRRIMSLFDSLIALQWISPADLRRLQELRLGRLIRHAYLHVPYYREQFDRQMIRPEQIETIQDLQKLPLLSQRQVREHLYFDLFADNHRKHQMQRIVQQVPGGSPLEIYVDRMQIEMGAAAALRGLSWRGRSAAGLRALLWREAVEQYGSPSLAAIAHECERQDGRHITAESYIVEVLDEGRAVGPGETGEVVITDLNGFAVPLIRYRTGARAMLIHSVCACGRPLPRLHVPADRAASSTTRLAEQTADSAAADAAVTASSIVRTAEVRDRGPIVVRRSPWANGV